MDKKYERSATAILRSEMRARGCATKGWTWTGNAAGDGRYLGELMDGRTRPPEVAAIAATRMTLLKGSCAACHRVAPVKGWAYCQDCRIDGGR